MFVVTTPDDGVSVILSKDEVALAVYAYMTAHDVVISGPRTVRTVGDGVGVFVDPSAKLIFQGVTF